MKRPRSEHRPSAEDRKLIKRLSDEQLLRLEKRIVEQGPAIGSRQLQEVGGYGVDRKARDIVRKSGKRPKF